MPVVDEDIEEETTLRFTETGIPIYDDIEFIPPPSNDTQFKIGENRRLMITKIVNHNFKSYFGTQVLGPFHKRYTSVIGPNGSGKSNLIDSMLFVFGYRASKIRSAKLSVLIHKSNAKQKVDNCTVTVHFCTIIDKGVDNDDYEVVPDSEFSVARTAHLDNSAFYSINGKRSPYKAVSKLLIDNGIDLDHNRFLILQGEVEQIAMMKPMSKTDGEDGMLEFLEDIIGTKRLKQPIKELSERIELLKSKCNEKKGYMKIIVEERDAVKVERDAAIEFLRQENKKIIYMHQMKQKLIYENEQHSDKCKLKLDSVKQKMQEFDESIKDIRTKVKDQSKLVAANKSEIDKDELEFERMKKDYMEFEVNDLKMRNKCKYFADLVSKLADTLEEKEKSLPSFEKKVNSLNKKIEKLESSIKILESDKEKAEENLTVVISNLKVETQGLQQEKDAYETEVTDLKKTETETKKIYDLSNAEAKMITMARDTKTEKLSNLEKSLQDQKSSLEQLNSKLSENQNQHNNLKVSIDENEKKLPALQAKEKHLLSKVRDCRVLLEEYKRNQESSKSSSKLLTSLMKCTVDGSIPGIYGRLGDLGAIDAKYDIAISTAAGELESIVVDTVETGKLAIQYLRDHELGSSNFIVLEKMTEKWGEICKRPLKTPEDVPRLFDMITMGDEKFRPAFYYVVRDCLVAEDIEQASRVAYGQPRYRVVTLDGKIIEKSGTLSGGGRPSRGRMGAKVIEKVNPQVAKKMETDFSTANTELTEVQEEKNQIETILDGKYRINKLAHEIKICQNEITDLDTVKIPNLNENIASLKEDIKNTVVDEKKYKIVANKVEKDRKDYEKAKKAALTISDKVASLQSEILEIRNNKMRSANNALKDISDNIENQQSEVVKLKNDIKLSEKNAIKCAKNIESIKEGVEKNTVLRDDWKEKMDKLTYKACEESEVKDELELKLEELKEQSLKLEADMKILERSKADAESETIDIKHQMKQLQTELDEIHYTIKTMQQEMKDMTLSDLDLDPAELQEAPLDDFVTLTGDLLSGGPDAESYKHLANTIIQQNEGVSVNMSSIPEFRVKDALYNRRSAELDEVTKAFDKQTNQHDKFITARREEFMAGFITINYKLKEVYQMITLGGDADLELIDSLNPFSEGIQFSVRPLNKSWKNISSLSGGEKTLSSLALVFALHHFKPTPLYIMDEIDAALDFRNVSIVGHYIKAQAKNAQFIIISLRHNMFELCDRLIGIYKTFDQTKSTTLSPQLILATLAANAQNDSLQTSASLAGTSVASTSSTSIGPDGDK